MHGCENRKRLQRMLSVSSSVNTRGVIPVVDNNNNNNNTGVADRGGSSLLKDIRKINIGDCALFKPPQESPPFIGIIRSLGSDKETKLQLGVTWLYRPADIQLLKGVAIEAAPNEVFYSFHRDEIPAASLLHPCKVAFLPKGAELPSGVSSFVCRRVYDTTNKRLWWLTDKDFINGRQEEVDQLLDKTQLEMHATTQQQQGGRSPKPVNSPTSASQLKHSPDSVQNSTTAVPSQSKGKKRERSDQGSHSSQLVKRERSSKADDVDYNILSSEQLLKSEIAKITEKGGLVESKSVERLVQLMHSDKTVRRIDITCRSLLTGVVAATDKVDCLNRFVQLRGLPVLDEWLQEVHKGKIGEPSSVKDHHKLVVDFLLTTLRALDRLPVNLNALQMCNIGKSVNHLRTHSNSDIQKKSRSLVDTWKKRVEAEMNVNDSRSGTNHGVSWPTRMRNEASHGVGRHSSASDAVLKNSPSQLSSSKSAPAKSIQGEIAKSAPPSPANVKLPSYPTSTSGHTRDVHLKTSVITGSSDIPSSAAKDEKSSSSSQSQTNSQCSSDRVKKVGPAVKEDARSSNSGSSLNKSSGSASRHRKAASNGFQGLAASVIHRESGSMKSSSLTRTSVLEKCSHPSTREKASDVPIADSNNHKIIVKISNRGRSPAQNVNGGSLEDPSSVRCKASSPPVPQKLCQSERSPKEKPEDHRNTAASDMIGESWQSNDIKDRPTAGDEPDRSPSDALDPGRCQAGEEIGKSTELNSRELEGSSLSSINALIDSCVKFSETNISMSAGDVVGMNLLASVAAGEISKSSVLSPVLSPQRSTSMAGESKANGDCEVSLGEPNQAKVSVNVEGQERNITHGASVLVEEIHDQPRPSGKELLPSGDTCMRPDGKLGESAPARSGCPPRAAGGEDSDQGLVSRPGNKNDNHVCTPLGVASCSASEGRNGDDSLKKENHERPADVAFCPKERRENKTVTKKLSGVVSSCINNLLPGQFDDLKEDAVDIDGGGTLSQGAAEKVKKENHVPPSFQMKEESELNDQNTRGNNVDLVSKELVSDTKDCSLPSREGEDAKDENHCGMEVSSPAEGSSFTEGKLDFDLNEGFDIDDSKDGDLPSTDAPGCLNCQLPSFSAASTSIGLPASITVTAAAKGPFVPPEDLLRNKGELGWRGSAATSAFRPAEPRKVSEVASGASISHISDVNDRKQGRVRLEIDLNVADESIIEDMDCQINDFRTTRNTGGLDLDLNSVDDSPDLGQPSPVCHRFDMPLHPIKFSSSSALSNSDSGRRGFDLNNGPATDEATVDSLSFNNYVRSNNHSQPSVGLRINNTEMGTSNQWYTAGSTFSAVPIPGVLPERAQPFPIAGTGSVPPRMWVGPSEAMPFNPDMFRGSVLSSNAVPYHSAPFQYPVFPFGSSFPLPSTSLPGGSTAYMDLSSGGRLCIPPQLVGNTVNVPSQYPRPYVVSLSDVSNSVAVDNAQKWGRQGLDLNSGPGGPDVGGRNDTLPMMPRPLMSSMSSFALTDEQARLYSMAGGALKRSEPDGGSDSDRLSYKQPSWQ